MQQLSDLSVSNIFLYIGDAVRWDALPERLAEQGLTAKTVAASIHTPSSFSSITTGLHVPQHGILDFNYRIDDNLPSMLHLDGFNTGFANSIDEVFVDNPPMEFVLDKVLNTSVDSYRQLESISAPFFFMERGPGGHAPYGNYDGNGWEYFRENSTSPTTEIRDDYYEGVEMDVSHFESQLQVLEDRGLLEDTLVIYSSDHGELLGEGGCLGHNEPIHPKHVYVPSVFIHPSLENTEMDGLLRHVDFFPTIASLLGADINGLPGRDLTKQTPGEQGTSFYHRSVAPNVPGISGELDYGSVWDSNGGYVFPNNGRLNRGIILAGKLLKASKRGYMRRHLRSALRFYLEGDTVYGAPKITRKDAKAELQRIQNLPETTASASDLNDGAIDRLQELGYLEN